MSAENPKYYRCGICDAYHADEFDGDCRDDSARFFPEDLDALHGALGWDEVPMVEGLPAVGEGGSQ